MAQTLLSDRDVVKRKIPHFIEKNIKTLLEYAYPDDSGIKVEHHTCELEGIQHFIPDLGEAINSIKLNRQVFPTTLADILQNDIAILPLLRIVCHYMRGD